MRDTKGNNMTYNEYQEATKTVEIRPQTATVNLRLMCSICGLLEEKEELFTANSESDIVKEAGDVLFYIASIAIETGITMEELKQRFTEIEVVSYVNTLPLKILKKTYRDMGGAMSKEYKNRLWGYLSITLYDILAFLSFNSIETTIEEIMEMNIAKLQDRLARGVIKGDGDTR